jgi:hypothetical protein
MGCSRTPSNGHTPCRRRRCAPSRKPRLSPPPWRPRGLPASDAPLRCPVKICSPLFPARASQPDFRQILRTRAVCIYGLPSRTGYTVLPTRASILSQPLRHRCSAHPPIREKYLRNQTGITLTTSTGKIVTRYSTRRAAPCGVSLTDGPGAWTENQVSSGCSGMKDPEI